MGGPARADHATGTSYVQRCSFLGAGGDRSLVVGDASRGRCDDTNGRGRRTTRSLYPSGSRHDAGRSNDRVRIIWYDRSPPNSPGPVPLHTGPVVRGVASRRRRHPARESQGLLNPGWSHRHSVQRREALDDCSFCPSSQARALSRRSTMRRHIVIVAVRTTHLYVLIEGW